MDRDPGWTAAPPPPPPPPPAPSRPAIPWWAAAAGLVLIGALVAAVLVLRDGGGTADTLAGSSSTSNAETTTSSPALSTTSLPTTTTTGATTTTAASSTTSSTTSTTLPGPRYGPAALAYFRETAGGAEYGDETGVLHKWTESLRVAVYGDPTARDRRALDAVIDDLNEIIGALEIALVESDPNIEIHFAPLEEFAAIEPNYVEGNLGYVHVWWDGAGSITSARVLISTTGLTPTERAHLIREELTQGLGMLRDSLLYPESIFYQGWTDTNRYTRLDRLVIEMLYRPELSPGMAVEEALTILAAL